MADGAHLARAAPMAERADHALARAKARNLAADLGDDATVLVSEHGGQRRHHAHPRHPAAPQCVVGTADSARAQFEDDVARAAFRVLPVFVKLQW